MAPKTDEPQRHPANKTPPNIRKNKPKTFRLFLFLCIYRLANAWMIRTQFDPDEYWQTLEPAYCLAFGSSRKDEAHRANGGDGATQYGCALTWEWTRRWTPSNETTPSEWGGNFLIQAMHGPVRSYVSILPTYWYYLGCRSFFQWAKNSSSQSLKYVVDHYASYMISKGPAFLHAVIVAAPTDLSVWWISSHLQNFGGSSANQSATWSFWALFLSLTSWFHGYALVRTYANCFETVCLMVGIALLIPELFGNYHAIQHRLKARLAFVLGGLSACIRFTALAAWIPLGLIVAIRSGFSSDQNSNDGSSKHDSKDRKTDCGAKIDRENAKSITLTGRRCYSYKAMCNALFGLCALYGAVGMAIGISIDRLMYGFWAIPFLGNFHFNVLLGHGSLYGTHPFLWYIYAGIPAMCGAILPLFLWETYDLSKHMAMQWRPELLWARRWRPKRAAAFKSLPASLGARLTVLGIVTPYVILHSFSEHKEFRFILPILPLIIVLAGHTMAQLFDATTCTKSKILTKNRAFVVISILNFPHLLYLGMVHQRGPIALNEYLTNTIAKIVDRDEKINIHYLMGCHSAPLYSHLHIPGVYINAWHLDCSPPCRSQHEVMCVSDSFLLDPLAFVKAVYGKDKTSDAVVCKSDVASQCSPRQLEELSTKEIPMYAIVMQDDSKKVESTLLHVLGMTHMASIPHIIKSLKWISRREDETCRSLSLKCYEDYTFLSLLGIEFDHIEIYQRIS